MAKQTVDEILAVMDKRGPHNMEWAVTLADEVKCLRLALTDTNALLGCIIAAWPSKEMLPKVEKQYDENLITLRLM